MKALRALETSLGQSHELTGLAIGGLGRVRFEQSQYAAATNLFQRSLDILVSKYGENDVRVATALGNLAIAIRYQGDYAKADSMVRRALSIRKTVLGPNHLDMATSLHDVGLTYWRIGEFAKAERYIQDSLKIKEKILGVNHPSVGSALAFFAEVKKLLGKVDESRVSAERSIDIYTLAFGADHSGVALGHEVLAKIGLAEGDLIDAEASSRKALQINQKCFGDNHADVARTLNLVGLVVSKQGKKDESLRLYLSALSVDLATFGEHHPNTVTVCNNIALAYLRMGQVEKAVTYLDRNRRSEIAYLNEILPSVSEMTQAVFLKQGAGAFEAAMTVAIKNSADESLRQLSAEWLTNSKSVIQQAFAARSNAASSKMDNEVSRGISRLRKLKARQAELTMAAGGRTGSERQKEMERLSKDIAAANSELVASGKSDEDEYQWIDLNETSASLSAKEALVDFVRFREHPLGEADGFWKAPRYAAWVTRQNGQVDVVDLGLADEIDELINQVLDQLKQDIHLLPEEGEEVRTQVLRKQLWLLSERVWQPIADQLGDVDHLVLSPDGQLWLIPWSALMVSQEGAYLIEEYNIRFVTSGRDLVTLDQEEPTKRPALFAAPLFKQDLVGKRTSIQAIFKTAALGDSQNTNRERLLPKVAALPNTAIEASGILPSLEKLAKKTPVLYEGRYALEYVAKRLESPSIVTFSTHGFFLPKREVVEKFAGLSAVSDSSTVSCDQSSALVENSLLRCGLLLSGCNNPEAIVEDDDGILTGLEITGINLRGTDLVVLSACETGVGDVQDGEGISGLRQAFQLAGAKSVLSSLWQVEDSETTRLMNLFFGQLSAGMSKSEALRQSQLARIKVRRERNGAAHPFFWAAFTLTGQD